MPAAPPRAPAAHVRAALAAVQAKPAPVRTSPAAHVQAALAQARQKAPLPVQAHPAATGRPASVQARVSPAPARKGGTAVQRAATAAVEMKQTESSQSTYLTATVFNARGSRQLTSGLASSPAGHSEDRLIDQVLPAAAAAGYLDAKSVNTLFIGINRSPCTSTVYTPSGAASCTKGGGKAGCTERLIHLATHGLTVSETNGLIVTVTTYTFKIYLDIREIYGANSAQRANSVAANEAMAAAGIEIEQQRIASSSKLFFASGAMKLLSMDMSE